MKAFISSTFVDLRSHRIAAADAIERLGIQLVRMESFGARPEDPSRACLEEIEQSDLFVGIYAHRYGYVPAGSSVSITESEFDRAIELRRPPFCFLVDKDFPWEPGLIESDPGQGLLNKFKTRLGSMVVRDIFTTPEVLATRVATAVGRYLIADPRRSGANSVAQFARNSLADGATAVFVDIMRLTCVSGSPLARPVNEPRYGEFVAIADQHLSDFRAQISRLSSDRDAELCRVSYEVETRLAFLVQRLRHSPVLGSPWPDFVGLLNRAARQIEELAVIASPEYFSTRTAEIAPIVERGLSLVVPESLLNPDVFVRQRFSMQSKVIDALQRTAALAIATIRDDMDRALAIPYFTIDSGLLRLAGGRKTTSA